MAIEQSDEPLLMQRLQVEENFFRFRDLFNERLTLVKESLNKEKEDIDQAEESNNLESLLAENEEERSEKVFELLYDQFEKDLAELSIFNKKELRR